MPSILVAAFYRFATLEQLPERRDALLQLCRSHAVLGTILLAPEGINGTVAGTPEAIEALLAHLRADPALTGLEDKRSWTEHAPFERLKVRLKREIVTLGVPGLEPARATGIEVQPSDWNRLIEDPDVLVIDTRNRYEVGIGTFKNAIDPATDSFRQFPDYVRRELDPARHKRIAMFCTGGIRCEKASAYLLAEGFENVYQLKGGVLKYLETVPTEDSLWQGECFVFDERVAVDHDLRRGSHRMCRDCGAPVPAPAECAHCGDERRSTSSA